MTEYYTTNNKPFLIDAQHNLICCDCGLTHSVILKTKLFSRKIFATYNREEKKTQARRELLNIAISNKEQKSND